MREKNDIEVARMMINAQLSNFSLSGPASVVLHTINFRGIEKTSKSSLKFLLTMLELLDVESNRMICQYSLYPLIWVSLLLSQCDRLFK